MAGSRFKQEKKNTQERMRLYRQHKGRLEANVIFTLNVERLAKALSFATHPETNKEVYTFDTDTDMMRVFYFGFQTLQGYDAVDNLSERLRDVDLRSTKKFYHSLDSLQDDIAHLPDQHRLYAFGPASLLQSADAYHTIKDVEPLFYPVLENRGGKYHGNK